MSCLCDTMTKKDLKQQRWLYEDLLALLLIIGCVETNPGPDTQSFKMVFYEKTKEHSKPTGSNYEWKFACLIFLRQVQKKEPFLLASNIKKCGKFDDIVLLIPGKSASFIQLKHKENKYKLKPRDFHSISGDFSFFQFYKSYCKIKSLSSTDAELKECGAFENFEFVLVTNSDYIDKSKYELHSKDGILYTWGQWFLVNSYANQELKDHFEELKKYADTIREMDSLMEHNEKDAAKQKIQCFRTTNEQINSLIQCFVKDPSKAQKDLETIKGCENFSLCEDFFSQMKVYIKQAKESCLESVIKTEIRHIFGTEDTDTNDIAKQMLENVYDWWYKDSYYLNQLVPFWCEIIQDRLESLRCKKVTELTDLDIMFEDGDAGLNNIVENIRGNQIIHIAPDQNRTILSCLKSFQALEKLNLKKNAILINYDTLVKRRVEVLSVLKRKWCDVLAIDCDSRLSDNHDTLFTEILNCIQQDMKLITIGILEVYTKLQRFLKGKLVHDSSCLAQCTNTSQNKLLQRKITFQGKQVPLSSLLTLNLTITNEIRDDIFCHIINQKSFKVGKELPKAVEYFGPRKLKHYVHIKKKNLKACILEGNAQIVFAISGMGLIELWDFLPTVEVRSTDLEDFFPENEPRKVYSICESDTNFKDLCQHHTTCDVHWFHLEQGIGNIDEERLIWRRSRGNMDIVQENLDAMKWCSEEPKRITDISERLVLIVAKSGMGKTTLLTHLAIEEKNINPGFWVVNIDLNSYGEVFKHLKKQNTIVDVNNVISFLGDQVIGIKNDPDIQFLKMVFRENIMDRGNVIVLLDAYNEISPDYTDIVSSMARVLIHHTKIHKLWVTTRPNKGKKLEEELCTLAYTLKPFCKNDQKIFLQEVWKQRMKNISKEYIMNFVTKLLTVADKSFNEKDRVLMGIPLQTKLLAEVYEEYLLESKELPSTLNMPELYERFMEKQFEEIFKKQGVNPKTLGMVGIYESHKAYLIKGHKMSGVQVKFPAAALRKLKGFKLKKRFLEELENDKERTGIIDGIFYDKRPKFTHQTYADYFCALWLRENYEENHLVLRQYLFSQDFEVVRSILDHMLTKDFPLHSSILYGNWEAALQHLDKAICLDEGRRTALHLAAGCGKPGKNYAVDILHTLSFTIYTKTEDETELDKIVQSLLQHGSQVNAVDGVLGWTPLQYAVHAPGGVSFRILGMLLEAGAEDEDGTLIQNDQLRNKQYIQDNIQIAIQEGYLKLPNWLIRNVLLKPDFDEPCENNRYSNTTTEMPLIVENGEAGIMTLFNSDNKTEDTKGNTALHAAAQSGNELAMEFLLDNGAFVDVQNQMGDTPLHLAASNGNMNAVIFLVKYGANSGVKNSNERTPLRAAAYANRFEVMKYLYENCDSNLENNFALHDAIIKDNPDMVKYLVNKVDNLNCQNSDGRSPLKLALLRQNHPMFESLIEAGADVNFRDSFGETPIFTAIERNDIKACKYLASQGASFNVINVKGETPLHHGVEVGELKMVEYLVSSCSDINAMNTDGVTPLMKAVLKNKLDFVKYLIEQKADHMVKDKHNNSLLHCATKTGNCDLMDYLLTHLQFSSELQSLNKEGETPMMTAAVSGKWDIVKLLSSKYNINICAITQNGDTLLHVAVEQGDEDATCWLLQNRYFNVMESKNKQGKTALHTATKLDKTNMLQCLIGFSKNKLLPTDFEENSPLHDACTSNVATTEFLIKNFDKREVNRQNKVKYTPLHKAVESNKTTECAKIISLLLKNGANSEIRDAEGRTPLSLAIIERQNISVVEELARHIANSAVISNSDLDLALYLAVLNGCWNLVPCLCEAGANKNLSNVHGLYPVHGAAERGEYSALLHLLSDNDTEDINTQDRYGITPLHYAAFQGHSEVIDELLNRGANINSKDRLGNTPLHCSSRRGHKQITKHLITNGADTNLRNENQEMPVDVAADAYMSNYLSDLMSRQSGYQ